MSANELNYSAYNIQNMDFIIVVMVFKMQGLKYRKVKSGNF